MSPNDVGVAGEVEAEPVLELDDEADRLAEVEGRLAAGVPVAGRMVGVGHRDLDARRPRTCRPCSCRSPRPRRPAAGGPATGSSRGCTARSVAAGWRARRHRPCGRSGRGSPASGRSARSSRPCAGCVGLPNHGSIRIVLPPGRPDLEAGVAVPGERRIADRDPSGHLRGSMLQRGYTRAVPATQIAQNLAFINWTVLTGLALGSFAAVVLLRRRTSATPGYLRFTAVCAARLRGPGRGLATAPCRHPRHLAGRRSTRPGTRRAGRPCSLFCVLVAASWSPGAPDARVGRAVSGPRLVAAARDARLRGPRLGRRLAGVAVAARPAGGRQRGHRRRLRGDDPGPLVPGHAQAARGAADPPRAGPVGRRRAPGRAVRRLGRRPAPGRPTSRRSRRSSGRGRCSSGCA